MDLSIDTAHARDVRHMTFAVHYYSALGICAEDTIITWSDPEAGTDVALSFQESAGCDRVWRQIQEVQDGAALRSPGDPLSPHADAGRAGAFLGHRHRGMVDEFEAAHTGPYDDLGPLGCGAVGGSALVELPEPELGNLPIIAKALTEATLFQKESLAAQILAPGYLHRLLACFKTAEDLEDEESLVAAHAAVKAAILLNDTALLETMFAEDVVMDVVGALEHDPDIPVASRVPYRKLLSSEDALREVVPIRDPATRAKILQSHRMGFVKDSVLPKALDDATFATLSSLQLFNNVEVLLALHADATFFDDLFRRLRKAEQGSPEWQDLVGFLQELTSLTRHLQASQRNAFLSKLAELGLFDVVTGVLQSGDDEARLRATDVLLAVVAHDPAPLRAHLQSEHGEGGALFRQLVSSLTEPSAGGLQEQALEILKVLLDPETMESSVEKDRFIDAFYDEHIGGLLAAIVAAGETPLPESAPPPATLVLLIELLCYCVTQHSYRIKYYILRNNVVEKVLRLLRRRERAVAAASLRFLRTCLAMRDEFYNRYLVKNSLLEPVIEAFMANGPRYNLLNSATLELFEFVRRENMKSLLGAVVESPKWPQLEEEGEYVETFKAMKLRHEANQEGRTSQRGPPTGGPAVQSAQQRQLEAEAATMQRAAAAAEARRRRGEREEDTDEESYFREDEDEMPPSDRLESGPSNGVGGRVVLESVSPLPGVLAGRLVDYADDEDDEDTLPLNGKPLGGGCSVDAVLCIHPAAVSVLMA